MHHHMGGHEAGTGMMPAAMMGALGAVLFALAVAGVLYVLNRRGVLDAVRRRALGQRPRQLATATASPSAVEYLDMALAKGELDIDEYYQRRSALRNANL